MNTASSAISNSALAQNNAIQVVGAAAWAGAVLYLFTTGHTTAGLVFLAGSGLAFYSAIQVIH